MAASARRTVQLARAAWGVTLLACPGAVVSAFGGADDSPTRAVGRVLGARHLVQGVVLLAVDAPAVAALGAGVDFLHAASMAAFGALDHDRRRVTLTDAAAAAAWGVLTAVTARDGG